MGYAEVDTLTHGRRRATFALARGGRGGSWRPAPL
jgi:hypothetical protein